VSPGGGAGDGPRQFGSLSQSFDQRWCWCPGTEAAGGVGGGGGARPPPPPPHGTPTCGVPPQIVLRYIQVGGAEKIHKRIFVHWANLFSFYLLQPNKRKAHQTRKPYLFGTSSCLSPPPCLPIAPARSSRA
jgi:hypothetical protein